MSKYSSKKTRDSFISKIRLLIKRINIYILVFTPIIVAILLLGFLAFIGDQIYEKNVPELYYAAIGVVFLITLSLSGIVQIFRQEGPGPLGYPIFGIWPTITGYTIVIVCVLGIIYLLAYMYTLLTG